GETRADVANGLVRLCRRVVAGKQEGAEDRGALPFAVVGAEDDEVEGVADTGEVVLLDLQKENTLVSIQVGNRGGCRGGGQYLEPVATPLAGFVSALGTLEHLNHEPFAGGLDALFQEALYLLDVVGVVVFCERKLPFDLLKGFRKELAALCEGFLSDGLYCKL